MISQCWELRWGNLVSTASTMKLCFRLWFRSQMRRMRRTKSRSCWKLVAMMQTEAWGTLGFGVVDETGEMGRIERDEEEAMVTLQLGLLIVSLSRWILHTFTFSLNLAIGHACKNFLLKPHKKLTSQKFKDAFKLTLTNATHPNPMQYCLLIILSTSNFVPVTGITFFYESWNFQYCWLLFVISTTHV